MNRRMNQLLATGAAVTAALASAAPAFASTSTPPSETAQAPAAGAPAYHSTWTGTIPVGSQPQDAATNACMSGGVLEDTHLVHYSAPADPAHSIVTLTFTVAWNPVTPDGGGNGVTSEAPASDMEIALRDASGAVVTQADGNENQEQIVVDDLPSGDYELDACGFVNAAPQPYTGTLDIATVAKNVPPPPVFEDTPTSGGPGPVVPEVPFAALLPLVAIAAAGFVIWRRRRS